MTKVLCATFTLFLLLQGCVSSQSASDHSVVTSTDNDDPVYGEGS